MSVASRKRRRTKRRHARGEWTRGELHLARSRIDGAAIFATNAYARHEALVAAELLRDMAEVAKKLGPPLPRVMAVVHPDDLAGVERAEPRQLYDDIPVYTSPAIAPGKPLVIPDPGSALFDLTPRRWR